MVKALDYCGNVGGGMGGGGEKDYWGKALVEVPCSCLKSKGARTA